MLASGPVRHSEYGGYPTGNPCDFRMSRERAAVQTWLMTATVPTDSDTLYPVTSSTVPPLVRYGRLWRGVPLELGFLLLALPVALVGFAVSITLLWTGIGTLVTFFIGVFVLIGSLYVARGFGTLELLRLEWAGQAGIQHPKWQAARAHSGFWGWLRSLFANGHYWLYLLHTAVVNFVISLISWTVTIAWLSVALSGVTAWFWELIFRGRTPATLVVGQIAGDGARYSPGATTLVLSTLLGIFATVTLPFVTRALITLHRLIANGMLGAFRSDTLQNEVIALGASRTAAVSAESTALRRLERDIHDGPQQRLVRLQMDLAAADRQIEIDPGAARVLISEAMQQSKDALEELRSLSRGFAPPLLLDRGLSAALDSLVARSPVAVRFVDELVLGESLPFEIERNAYFVASELVTNVAKHAAASAAELRVGRIAENGWLRIAVSDDGVGGAIVTPEHGLAGLDERVRGLGGTLSIDSPAGGPTDVVALIPSAA